MLTVKEWMELVDYRMTEGDSYLWKCFGNKAFSLSAWNGDHNGWSFNMVFDTGTQTVYTVEVCDYVRDRAYRMINPHFKAAHDQEAQHRGVSARQAWDDVNFVDLDVVADFIQKSEAIKADEDYDTRVTVELDLADDVLFQMMQLAHERDVTFNQLVESALKEAIDQAQRDDESDESDGWDDICEAHLDDDDDEMASDLLDLAPAAKMKSAKKKHKKKHE